jgi:hypothetical protein
MKCAACNKEASIVGYIDSGKIWIAETDWYNGIVAMVPDFFETRGLHILFACTEKHLHKIVVKKTMLERMKEK